MVGSTAGILTASIFWNIASVQQQPSSRSIFIALKKVKRLLPKGLYSNKICDLLVATKIANENPY